MENNNKKENTGDHNTSVSGGDGTSIAENAVKSTVVNWVAEIAGEWGKPTDGEFVIPADVVAELGNGSSEKGLQKIHAFMDDVINQNYLNNLPPKEEYFLATIGNRGAEIDGDEKKDIGPQSDT